MKDLLNTSYEAVIFDMDGLIIDSEPFWKQAEREVFARVGVPVDDELARVTAAMTTREVTSFWYHRFPWEGTDLETVEQMVVDRVESLIREQGRPLPGVYRLLSQLISSKLKIGLATNSPQDLVPVVFEKLGIGAHFDQWTSADEVVRGKPDPEIYYKTAVKLGISPVNCVVFEDSVSGMQAALEAGMHVIVVSGENHPDFRRALRQLRSLDELDWE